MMKKILAVMQIKTEILTLTISFLQGKFLVPMPWLNLSIKYLETGPLK